jgi:transposase
MPESPPPEPAVETKVAGHTRKRRHPGRYPFPDHLPREVIDVPLSEEEKVCSECGSEMAALPPEITKELERVPPKLFVREYHREKCACRACQQKVNTAPPPSRPIDKGMAGPGLMAQVVVDKFADHIPLYRQEKRLAREGVRLGRQTLCGWLPQLDRYTGRIVKAMKQDILDGGYIQADETPIAVQTKHKSGKNHQGYLWPYGRPHGPIVFDFRMSRGRDGPKNFLRDYRGILQHDGYAAYLKLGDEILHMGCMGHVRRKFWEAQKIGEQRAVKIVRAIDRLFAIERLAKKQNMGPDERLALRQQRSVKRMDLLKLRIQRLLAEVLPKSKVGKACTYALSQWPYLVNYLNDGRIEISNNLCENSIRPIAVGRRNWLHIGSEAAGPVAANFMSLVETCRRYHVDPLAYFTDIFSRIADHPVSQIAELTPYNWAEARRQAGLAT